jgi:hypothetical protein
MTTRVVDQSKSSSPVKSPNVLGGPLKDRTARERMTVLRAEDQVIDDNISGLTTPWFRKHVDPFGKYPFDLERMRQTEGGPEQGVA